MKKLSHDDLRRILDGSCILGAGGGGPRSIGEEYLKKLLKRPPILLADPKKDIKASQLMAVAAGVGSPDAATKGFPMDVPVIAFKKLNKLVKAKRKKSLSFVLPGEVGAGNTFVPLGVASDLGLPVVDASSARRAIPALTQCTYADLPISPVILANDETEVDFSVATVAEASPTLRGIISSGSFTQDAGVAFWHMNGSTVRRNAVPNTMSYALRLGRILHKAIQKKKDPVEAVRKFLNGYILFVGKIVDSSEHTTGGFDFGTITLENKSKVRMTIYNQNENLIAWRSDSVTPQAIAPDLISYLTTDGLTFSNADLDIPKGKTVAVIGSRCTRYLRKKSIVAEFQKSLVGIGYAGEYMPIEKLHGGIKKVRKIGKVGKKIVKRR